MIAANNQISAVMPHEERIAVMLANGFVRKSYPSQEGEFIAKTVAVERLPYAEKMIDGDYIAEGMKSTTELCPDGKVQLSIDDADYVEAYQFDSDEGLALVNDALLAIGDTAGQA